MESSIILTTSNTSLSDEMNLAAHVLEFVTRLSEFIICVAVPYLVYLHHKRTTRGGIPKTSAKPLTQEEIDK